MSSTEHLRRVVEEAIAEGQTPGAVILVGQKDQVLYHEAFGHRMLLPEPRPMTRDTIFDLASLTKPLATATAILHLAERGRLLLQDPVSVYLPSFTGEGREQATLLHLLTHTAGLPAYKNYLSALGEQVPPHQRRARVVEDICTLPLEYPVGERFSYSCLGYILLASVVEIVSGQPLNCYCARHVYAPLEMADTCFNPGPQMRHRCAATEQLAEGVLVGVVHDENARYLNGVGGNAGLFSTAEDVARFMSGLLQPTKPWCLSTAARRLMLTPQTKLPKVARTVGWDYDTGYTPQVRGDLFSIGGIGHSGYTGTSVWGDPETGLFVILLTNRIHLGRDRDISRLRQQVANIAAGMA